MEIRMTVTIFDPPAPSGPDDYALVAQIDDETDPENCPFEVSREGDYWRLQMDRRVAWTMDGDYTTAKLAVINGALANMRTRIDRWLHLHD